ncbi:RidA family protein [Oleomonas cavernae]|uniref:RidA family protein n=1 Tax=Oleomonas cavernae TaxID=2320859 RepID=A0A418WCK1_9PROT|nr:RidA family protein [Oleomonas cavernae]RJF87762.1 RidA family protein [Oleomonas cavernae]
MTGKVDARLAQLGLTLPTPVAPVANYVPFTIVGNLLFISGQLPLNADGLVKGTLGQDISVEAGYAAARTCAVNLIAQAKAALGDLDRVTRVAKIGAFIACAAGFTDQPKVANGASDLMVEVFGEAGRHARSAVGTNALPLGAAVEVDVIIEFA